jgi:hypothetical protein
MKSIKIRSGGTAYLLGPGETCKAGEICFTFEEFDWVKTKSKDFAYDPELSSEFWKTLLEKKKTNSSYSFFEDFPKNNGLAICNEIIKMLQKKI